MSPAGAGERLGNPISSRVEGILLASGYTGGGRPAWAGSQGREGWPSAAARGSALDGWPIATGRSRAWLVAGAGVGGWPFGSDVQREGIMAAAR